MPVLSVDELERALASSKYKPSKETRLIGYARVSTEEQNLDMQTTALKRAGVHEDDLYYEHRSGVAKKRPRLAAALRACRPGDVLVVWRLDRLGRSMKELLERFEWFRDNGVGFRSLTESIDTTTPLGMLYVHLAAPFAEFERQLISYRTKTGVARKKEQGFHFGAPLQIDLDKCEAMLRRGMRVSEIAGKLGVSPATVYQHFPGPKITLLRDQGPKKSKR